jgi:hypothetical protein
MARHPHWKILDTSGEAQRERVLDFVRNATGPATLPSALIC